MDILKQLEEEFAQEYKITKKFLNEFPEGKNDYSPHEKSMKLLALAEHIVGIFGWPAVVLKVEETDMANELAKNRPRNKEELLSELEKNQQSALEAIHSAKESDLEEMWRLIMKGQVIHEWTKYGAIRHSLDQITHHRAQLGVYYRLLDLPVPSSYGPSADEKGF